MTSKNNDRAKWVASVSCHFIMKENNYSKAEENLDTSNRKAIQDTIIKMLKEGKSKLEIKKCLDKKFENVSENLKKYFEQYIENHARKINSKNINNGECR